MARLAKYKGVPGCVDPMVLITYADDSTREIQLTLPADTTQVRVIVDGVDIRTEQIKAVQQTSGEQRVWDDELGDFVTVPDTPNTFQTWLLGRYPIRYLRQETSAIDELGSFHTDAIFLVGEAYEDWITNEIVTNELEFNIPTEAKQILQAEPVDGIGRSYWTWPEFKLAWTDETIIPNGDEFNLAGNDPKTLLIDYFDENTQTWTQILSEVLPQAISSAIVECSECDADCLPMQDANGNTICLCDDGEPNETDKYDYEPYEHSDYEMRLNELNF